MWNIIILITYIILSILLYKTYDTKGFKTAFIVYLIFEIGYCIINQSMQYAFKFGVKFFLAFLSIKVVCTFIYAKIGYWVFKNTNHFLAFILLSSIIIYFISGVFEKIGEALLIKVLFS